ncbi:hypothetical protein M3Y98_00303500 [Aphelenchoides besseyi]|nr:hypothetical protein M3Y98_00303500 [Aphelenchoides besseyi]
MGYGDRADFVNRKPLAPDVQQQLRQLNLVTHNFGVKGMHAVFAALGHPKAPLPEVKFVMKFHVSWKTCEKAFPKNYFK